MDGEPAPSLSKKEICSIPLRGFLMGIYPFYENWSTETFGKKKSKRRAVCCTCDSFAGYRIGVVHYGEKGSGRRISHP